MNGDHTCFETTMAQKEMAPILEEQIYHPNRAKARSRRWKAPMEVKCIGDLLRINAVLDLYYSYECKAREIKMGLLDADDLRDSPALWWVGHDVRC